MAELKKCMCGGINVRVVQVYLKDVPHTDNGFYPKVQCSCGMSTQAYSTEAEAITAWNTRPLEADLLGALEKIKTKIVSANLLCGRDQWETKELLNEARIDAEQALAKHKEQALNVKMCGRCYDEVMDLYDAPCQEKPELLAGAPIGQYHCPDCGAMVIAGLPHPKLCQQCMNRTHPGFDKEQK